MSVHEQLEASLELERAQDIAKMRPATYGQPSEVNPMALLQIAMSQNADIDKLTKLMELQERWEAREAVKAFNAAMAKFKANPPKINKNKEVGFGNTKYSHATLDHVVDQITASLSDVGISHKWTIKQIEKDICVSCILTHEMGHSEETELRAMADTSGSKNGIQAIGSTVTYLQRYTLLSATGMAAAGMDTDGGNKTKGKEMSTDEYERYCGLIENAGSFESLDQIYVAAVKDANDLGDKGSVAKFKEVAGKRHRELKNATR